MKHLFCPCDASILTLSRRLPACPCSPLPPLPLPIFKIWRPLAKYWLWHALAPHPSLTPPHLLHRLTPKQPSKAARRQSIILTSSRTGSASGCGSDSVPRAVHTYLELRANSRCCAKGWGGAEVIGWVHKIKINVNNGERRSAAGGGVSLTRRTKMPEQHC